MISPSVYESILRAQCLFGWTLACVWMEWFIMNFFLSYNHEATFLNVPVNTCPFLMQPWHDLYLLLLLSKSYPMVYGLLSWHILTHMHTHTVIYGKNTHFSFNRISLHKHEEFMTNYVQTSWDYIISKAVLKTGLV